MKALLRLLFYELLSVLGLLGGSLGGLLTLLALEDGVCHLRGNPLDRADRVIVARNGVIDFIGVTVGVDDRNDRNMQRAG